MIRLYVEDKISINEDKIISSVFSNHNSRKPEINCKEKCGEKILNYIIQSNIFLIITEAIIK